MLSPIIEGENREITAARVAEELAAKHGFILLHPFEDLEVMAGQGTAALEMAEHCQQELGVSSLDAFICPAGGGGLAAGCTLAMDAMMPDTPCYAVEPELFVYEYFL